MILAALIVLSVICLVGFAGLIFVFNAHGQALAALAGAIQANNRTLEMMIERDAQNPIVSDFAIRQMGQRQTVYGNEIPEEK